MLPSYTVNADHGIRTPDLLCRSQISNLYRSPINISWWYFPWKTWDFSAVEFSFFASDFFTASNKWLWILLNISSDFVRHWASTFLSFWSNNPTMQRPNYICLWYNENSVCVFEESLRHPKRRLIRDSKKSGLSLLGSNRFATHNFTLFSDMLVHQQFSNHEVSNQSKIPFLSFSCLHL